MWDVCVFCVCVFRVLGVKVWMAWVLVDMTGCVFAGGAVVGVSLVETLFGWMALYNGTTSS